LAKFFREHNSIIVLFYIAGDMLAIALAAGFAGLVRFGSIDLPENYRLVVLLAILFAALIFPAAGLYSLATRQRWSSSRTQQIILGWGLVALLLVVMAFLFKAGSSFSRQWAGYWVLTTFPLLIAEREIAGRSLSALRRRGWNVRRIVIVGTAEFGAEVGGGVLNDKWNGYTLLGYVDTREYVDTTRGDFALPAPYLGNINQLSELIQTLRADEVWLCLPFRAEATIRQVQDILRYSTVTQRFLPNLADWQIMRQPATEVLGYPAIDLAWTPMGGVNRFLKAAEDQALALIIVTLVSPLMLAIAVGVKLSSPGPVFYRQTRVSWNGAPFEMLKFRSMPVDAEQDSGPVWNKQGDERATAFGAFLRRTSLDELPQFINVLKGEMSIVGPRPERPVFVEKFKDSIPGYMKKHLVKAGITGWAQINGWRGDTDLTRRIEHDMYYIERWSLLFDFRIIMLTVWRGFIHKNAR